MAVADRADNPTLLSVCGTLIGKRDRSPASSRRAGPLDSSNVADCFGAATEPRASSPRPQSSGPPRSLSARRTRPEGVAELLQHSPAPAATARSTSPLRPPCDDAVGRGPSRSPARSRPAALWSPSSAVPAPVPLAAASAVQATAAPGASPPAGAPARQPERRRALPAALPATRGGPAESGYPFELRSSVRNGSDKFDEIADRTLQDLASRIEAKQSSRRRELQRLQDEIWQGCAGRSTRSPPGATAAAAVASSVAAAATREFSPRPLSTSRSCSREPSARRFGARPLSPHDRCDSFRALSARRAAALSVQVAAAGETPVLATGEEPLSPGRRSGVQSSRKNSSNEIWYGDREPQPEERPVARSTGKKRGDALSRSASPMRNSSSDVWTFGNISNSMNTIGCREPPSPSRSSYGRPRPDARPPPALRAPLPLPMTFRTQRPWH
eukprot:TRINITY_DN31802_c0_g1_i1.p1 TRINITY_DN31802_c0_g1~~TRINITY_DN31802_c0_g1_i1.p1  ORF type:complete len:465 (+),score=69.58 TRINITY_DN31802_c0_g1_i1:68-1396(+)